MSCAAGRRTLLRFPDGSSTVASSQRANHSIHCPQSSLIPGPGFMRHREGGGLTTLPQYTGPSYPCYRLRSACMQLHPTRVSGLLLLPRCKLIPVLWHCPPGTQEGKHIRPPRLCLVQGACMTLSGGKGQGPGLRVPHRSSTWPERAFHFEPCTSDVRHLGADPALSACKYLTCAQFIGALSVRTAFSVCQEGCGTQSPPRALTMGLSIAALLEGCRALHTFLGVKTQ